MRIVLILTVALGGLLPAAHGLRWHGAAVALAWLVPLALAATGREFARRAAQLALLAGSLDLLGAGLDLVRLRLALGQPWGRLAAIMAVAGLVPLAGAWAFEHRLLRPAEPRPERTWPGLAAWSLTLAALGAVQLKAPPGLLLAERFLPGSGWLEAVLLAAYAGFAAQALLAPGRYPAVRRRVWTLFSAVFFGQLALGLAGFGRFLMSGTLHLPVPALIAAGPLYRGEGFFMAALFGVCVLLVGPAWCSHLCYIGAWDSACAGSGPPRPVPAWAARARAALAVLVLAGAFGLGWAGVSAPVAAGLAAGFGLAGVGVMLGVSRRQGVMAHCLGYCPMGLVSGLLGRLSPWRLRIGAGCTGCGACSRACRYGALEPRHLAAHRPGLSCSLCGDCLERCPGRELSLTVFGRRAPWVRPAFAALAAALCAVFLGVARL